MIGAVTPEKMQIVPRFDDRRSFATWRSEMDWNTGITIFDFRVLIGNHFCTLCETLARFGSVTPEI